MNSEILVSICIPTYNRVEYLKKSIDSIVCQKEFLEGNVEIVVSDNESTDDTPKLCDLYRKKYNNFIYSRNETNVRDRNFPKVLSLGHGRLRKLCNDTLVFSSDSLLKLCEVAKNYNDTRPYIHFTNGGSNYKETLTSFREYLLKVSYNVTWIGAFSIWDTECLNLENDTDGCELLLWQVRKACELGSKKNNCLIIDGNLFKTQTIAKKDISYGLYQIFFVNYFALLEPYFENGTLGQYDREYLEKDLLYKFFTQWIIDWEEQTGGFMYSKTENLKESVFNEYKDKSYFNKYLLFYTRKKYKKRIKQKLRHLFYFLKNRIWA